MLRLITTPRHMEPSSAMIRSVIEGITFGMTDALRIMQGMNIDVKTIYLTGGGSRSIFWRQIQADTYNVPVALTNSKEGAAYGVAILAGVGTGVWKSVAQACSAILEETEKRKPEKKSAAHYAKVYAEYTKLYPTLKDTFQRLAGL